MKYEVILYLLFLFLIYSFLGWVLEVIALAVKERKFVNRGITNGPFCTIYGIGAVLCTIALADATNVFSVFIGCLVYVTILEFITGRFLEKFNKNEWWDYSHKRFNLDGYICLEYSLLWGALGVLMFYIINPFLKFIFSHINIVICTIFVFILLLLIIIDDISSFVTLKFIKTDKMKDVSNRLGNWIFRHIKRRLEKAYPNVKKKPKVKENFAEGFGFYKLFAIFLFSSFLGAIVEMIYCRYSMGRWMSRSSLIFGEVSLVWGLALVVASVLLYRYRNRDNTFLFFLGTIIGGAYEYICSVFTEFFFGTIFWDYSKIPFNINGRINLLYCFFWGFATVIFIKKIYPVLSECIEAIPRKIGIIVANIMFVVVVIDLILTGSAMMRYKTRNMGEEATNIVEVICDKCFDDEFMESRWQNMKRVKKD